MAASVVDLARIGAREAPKSVFTPEAAAGYEARMWRETVLVVALGSVVVQPVHAFDPRPRCVAKGLKAASRAVRELTECRGEALDLGRPIDVGCVEQAIHRFTQVRMRSGLLCEDDGPDRLESTLGGIEASSVYHLAVGGGSGCQAKKLRAAGERAAATLRATAGVYRKLHAGPHAQRAKRAAGLVRTIRKARRQFAARFTRLEEQGGCVTTGDAAVGGRNGRCGPRRVRGGARRRHPRDRRVSESRSTGQHPRIAGRRGHESEARHAARCGR